jgi:hypothetical protein
MLLGFMLGFAIAVLWVAFGGYGVARLLAPFAFSFVGVVLILMLLRLMNLAPGTGGVDPSF